MKRFGKLLQIIFLTGVFIAVGSCSNGNGANGLTLTLARTNDYLLNTSIVSCLAEQTQPPTADVPAVSVDLGNITMNYTGSGNLVIQYIALSITGTNVASYTSILPTTEYPYLFTTMTIPSGSSLSSTNCTLRFGSISVTNTALAASGEGKITVYGVPDDNSAPVSSDVYFNFNFVPIN